MKKILLLLFVLIKAQMGFNQTILFDNIWLSGTSKVIFNGLQKPTTDTFTTQSSTYFFVLGDGGTNICDSAGNLVLMTSGISIHGKDKKIIENGDSIVPNQAINYGIAIGYSQTNLFLPFPNNQYYLINPTVSDSLFLNTWYIQNGAPYDLLLAHKIDMNANNGKGKVVQKNKRLLENVLINKTNMMACKHGNGTDWWLMKQGLDSNFVYKFLVTADSIYNYGTQAFNVMKFGKWDPDGQAMFSQDGTQYAVCIKAGGYLLDTINNNTILPGKFMVTDFDRCSGVLSNPKVYQTKPGLYLSNDHSGLCFSPNGRFIYVSSYYNIKQLDLLDTDTSTQWSEIANWDTSANFQGYSNMYLGPDNRLYIGNRNGTSNGLSAILYPNNKGVACGWSPKYLHFPHNVGPLPCMPDYHLGTMPGCYPLSLPSPPKEDFFEVYPNPATSKLHIKYVTAKHEAVLKELYNSIGQLIISTKENEIDVQNLSKGMYYLKVGNESKKVVVE